ncbi:class I SAM-dependent DNA methyltransferase [Candidatus Poribacteria bacterium]|nr:class I SAM-dependent DNA methyltransferase [Candidatus Poribacteria bacterium]
MRLSWNEIRARAAAFAQEWADANYERGETHLFYCDFFAIFDVSVRRVASFEEHVKLLDDKHGFIDLFWKGVLLVEQKSAGLNLAEAKAQALSYFPGINDADLPRYLLLSDFQIFKLYDLDEGESAAFTLAELPENIEKFGFILGVQRRSFRDQDPVNIEASERVGKLHDALADSGYTGHDLEQFLVRIVFCFFADDTGIFEPRDIFLDLLENRTREDGSDLGPFLTQLFQVLNTPVDQRSRNLDEDLDRFPYVNGDLFREQLLIPSFNAEMRQRLIDAGHFNWSEISPAIFGSLFQSVMDTDERRAQGAHYTTEKNILKVIEPLFLDELRAEFQRLRERRDNRRLPELIAFQHKLGRLRFFDPACGCGNFLIIAYRELRTLEIEVLKEIRPHGQLDLLAQSLSVVDVDAFYGIELGEFPVHIAEVAMWMMDHIMNNRLSLEFGQTYVRIPLEKSPHIRYGDALEFDWAELLPPGECFYVLGNPPFVGAKYQSTQQREQVRNIAALGRSGGTLDYVTAWFIKAGEYIQQSEAQIGFVATNSITQGEQVAQLWPLLFDRCKVDITFAHRTFAWGSNARGMAHVHVVIIGLAKREAASREKRLFSYETVTGEPHESRHAALSPYLFDASGLTDPRIVVKESSQSLNGLPALLSGSQPIDDGNYIFKAAERAAFLQEEPNAEQYLRPFIGSREFLQGGERWILALQDANPVDLRTMPKVVERMQAVRAFRAKSKRKSTLAIADYPTQYNVNVVPTAPFLVIPEVSSERREYVPIGWLEPPVIPSNLVRIIENANKPLFALLTSAMHMTWLRHIGGRLESRYRYSIGLVYNTFPMPQGPAERLQRLEPYADAVLAARAAYPNATLADLYDPDLMPVDLRRAHRDLDRAVDRLYRRPPFSSDRERVEHLLGLYEKMMVPLAANNQPRRRRRRR